MSAPVQNVLTDSIAEIAAEKAVAKMKPMILELFGIRSRPAKNGRLHKAPGSNSGTYVNTVTGSLEPCDATVAPPEAFIPGGALTLLQWNKNCLKQVLELIEAQTGGGRSALLKAARMSTADMKKLSKYCGYKMPDSSRSSHKKKLAAH